MQKFILESENSYLRQAINSHEAFDAVAREAEETFSRILGRRGEAPGLQGAAPLSQHELQAAAVSSSSSSTPLAVTLGASSKRAAAPVGFTKRPRTAAGAQQKRELSSSSGAQQQPELSSSSGAQQQPEQKKRREQQPEQQQQQEQQQQPEQKKRREQQQRPEQQQQQQPEQKQRRPYTEDELMDMRAESAVAAELGLSWQERGPPPSHGPLWRNQEYRSGSERWANRGGASKGWYTAFYKAKRTLDKEALRKWLLANPKPDKP